MADRSVTVGVDADVSGFVRGLAAASAAASKFRGNLDNFSKSLNTSTDRSTMLVQGLTALGPALVPIGGVAIGAIAGLASGLGAAAIAAGTAVLAFQGVGDALKAANDYSMSPTIENLEKMQIAMRELGPHGQEFVAAVQEMKPALDSLQNSAAAGLFPGLIDGMEGMVAAGPAFERLVSNMSGALGSLASDAGNAARTPFWQSYIEWLGDDGSQDLMVFGEAMGNFTHGIAAAWQALDPLADGFNESMLSASEGFESWGESLSESQGFQEFVTYIRDNGPAVAETLGAMGNAFSALVEAAAPVGSASMPILEQLFDTIGAIASSDIGPTLIGIAAGMAALQRAMAVKTMMNTGALGALLGTGGMMSTTLANARALPAALAGSAAAYLDYGRALDTSAKGAAPMAAAQTKLTTAMGAAGRVTSGVAGLALAFTDLGDSFELKNTATFALLGGMFGPWGAAAGALAGALTDAAAANNDFMASFDRADQIMQSDPLNFDGQIDAIGNLQTEFDKLEQELNGGGLLVSGDDWNPLDNVKDRIEGMFGESDLEEAAKMLETAKTDQAAIVENFSAFAEGFNNATGGTALDTDNLQQVSQYMSDIQPKLSAIGVSMSDIASGDVSFGEAVTEIRSLNAATTSMPGQLDSLGSAVSMLSDDFYTTAEGADALSSALQSLIGTFLDAEEAADALATSTASLDKDLKGPGKETFKGFTQGALEARQVTRDWARDLLASADAMAQNNASGEQVAMMLARNREAFIQEGIAAGFSRQQMEARANAMGLTPKMVSTTFRALGLTETMARAAQLVVKYNALPKAVRTDIKANGIPETEAGLARLKRRYDLTPEQVRTIIEARDNASGPIERVNARLKDFGAEKAEATLDADPAPAIGSVTAMEARMRRYDGLHPRPPLDANNAPAMGSVNAAENALNRYGGLSPSATLNANDNASGTINSAAAAAQGFAGTYTAVLTTVRRTIGSMNPFGNKDGGLIRSYDSGGVVRGPGGPRDDRIPAMLSNGEFVVNAMATAKNIELLHRLNAKQFAEGGVVGHRVSPLPAGATMNQRPSQPVEMVGQLTVTNWSTGEARFKAIAKNEVGVEKAYDSSRKRQQRRNRK